MAGQMRVMTKAEIDARMGLTAILTTMTYSEAMSFLVNELVLAAVHMGTPRHVLDALVDAAWAGHQTMHLAKGGGVA